VAGPFSFSPATNLLQIAGILTFSPPLATLSSSLPNAAMAGMMVGNKSLKQMAAASVA